jgi:arsenate reductase-like glutaredoxin family protein
MIENQSNEITLIYNSDKADSKKARALVESLPGYTIKMFDLMCDPITTTQIVQIADKAGVRIEELIDPFYDDHISIHSEGVKIATSKEMLKLMVNDTKLIATPIIIVGVHAYLCNASYDLIKEKLAIGIDAIPHAHTEEKQ